MIMVDIPWPKQLQSRSSGNKNYYIITLLISDEIFLQNTDQSLFKL